MYPNGSPERAGFPIPGSGSGAGPPELRAATSTATTRTAAEAARSSLVRVSVRLRVGFGTRATVAAAIRLQTRDFRPRPAYVRRRASAILGRSLLGGSSVSADHSRPQRPATHAERLNYQRN